MNKLTKKLSKTVAILMAATTIASTGIISAGAYSTYGSSSTAAASKGGYNIYKYGVSRWSYSNIYNASGKSRFVIPQVIVFKKNANGDYKIEDYSSSNAGILKKSEGRFAAVSQASSTRKYWHRGILKTNTSYSSGVYYVYDFYKTF